MWILALTAGVPCFANSAGQTTIPSLHSHNDYNRKSPLFEAIEAGLDSVEADVWLVDNTILVSHLGFHFRGSLERLYLEPLQKLVNERGSVLGDGREFYLWIDLKEGHAELRDALRDLLRKYPMFTRFYGNRVHQQGPVTAVLTGNHGSKTRFTEETSITLACRDSNRYSVSDAAWGEGRNTTGWNWYALRWGNHFDWEGKGDIPAHEAAKLLGLVEDIHEKGRRVRFWGVPDNERVWSAMLAAGVDMIGTDNPGRLRRFAELIPQWLLWVRWPFGQMEPAVETR